MKGQARSWRGGDKKRLSISKSFGIILIQGFFFNNKHLLVLRVRCFRVARFLAHAHRTIHTDVTSFRDVNSWASVTPMNNAYLRFTHFPMFGLNKNWRVSSFLLKPTKTRCVCETKVAQIMAISKDKKVTRTNILIPVGRSCHKKCSCAIRRR